MTPRARSRLISIIIVVLGLSLAAGFALYGLSGKITYFHAPSDLTSGTLSQKIMTRPMRIGGMVKEGSLKQQGGTYNFIVTDFNADLPVTYRGILPDLFREGQGIVADGKYDTTNGRFTATQILAKHDENYMPPDVDKMMKRVKAQ